MAFDGIEDFRDAPDYYEDPNSGCAHLIGYWKNSRCNSEVVEGKPFCKACGLEVEGRKLAEALADPTVDAELLAAYREDVADYEGFTRTELALAA